MNGDVIETDVCDCGHTVDAHEHFNGYCRVAPCSCLGFEPDTLMDDDS